MSRTALVRVGRVVAALVCALSMSIGAAPLEKSKVMLAVGGKATLYYLPLVLAERLGYFKDEGLEVEISDFPGGAKALQALVGGSADVVSGGYEHTLQMAAKGQKLQAFVLQGSAALSLGLVKGKFANYAGPQDLKGKKIGVTAPGSSTHLLVNQLLASVKLSPDSVSIIGVGTGASAIAAARGGQIDALSSIEPAMLMLEQSGDAKVVHETFTPEGARAVFGGPMPSACLYAKQEFVKANPNTVQALTNAMVRSLKWLEKATPEDVIKVIPPEYTLGDKALYATALTRFRGVYSKDGIISKGGVDIAYKVTAIHDTAVSGLSSAAIESSYTEQFVKAANALKR